MANVERELDRYLSLLRRKIRQRQFTQLEVQDALGWGRSYISQLLTKQKALRLEQVFSMLHVIGVEPREFFLELYVTPSAYENREERQSAPNREQPLNGLPGMTSLTHGLRDLLLKKGLITTGGLSAAVREAKREA